MAWPYQPVGKWWVQETHFWVLILPFLNSLQMSIFISLHKPLMNPSSQTPFRRDGGVSFCGRYTVLKCSTYPLLTESQPCVMSKGRNTKGQGCQNIKYFSFVLWRLGNFNFKNPANSSTVLELPTCVPICPPDDAMSQLTDPGLAFLSNTCLYWGLTVLKGWLFQGAAMASFHTLNPNPGLMLNSFLSLTL